MIDVRELWNELILLQVILRCLPRHILFSHSLTSPDQMLEVFLLVTVDLIQFWLLHSLY